MSSYDKAEIIKILEERDGMLYDDAVDLVEDVQYQIDALINAGVEGMAGIVSAERIIQVELGLEPDYLMDFIPVC